MIKRQALADFLVEVPQDSTQIEVEQESAILDSLKRPSLCWQVYVDGTSRKEKRDTGILLINPERNEVAYSLRFLFPMTNNMAEYEVLLDGLRLSQ